MKNRSSVSTFTRLAGVVAACVLLLTACGGDGDPGSGTDGGVVPESARAEENELVLISSQDPGNWDITQTANSFLWLWLPNNVLETLLVFDDEGEAQPKLAESWEVSEDALQYTFHLREGVTFHNGDPLTAADVAFSFQTFKDSPNAALNTPWKSVASIDAVDDVTLSVTLSQPSQRFFRGLGGVSGTVLSQAAFGEIATKPVGTGPYSFERYQADSGVTLSAYEAYWGDAPAISEVDVRFMPDASAALNSLKAGETDAYPFLGVEMWERVDTEGFRDRFNVPVEDAGGQVMYVAFNTREAPYDDKALREAIVHAIQRQPYADAFAAPWGISTTCTFATPDSPLFVPDDDDDCPYPYEPETTSSLLADAGLADTALELSTITDVGNLTPPGDVLRAQLDTAGVKVDDDARAFAQYAEQVFSGTPPQFGVTPMFTPRGMEQFVCTDPANAPWHSYCNPDLSALIDQADAAASPEQEADLLGQAMQILKDDAVVVPILSTRNVGIFHPDIEGSTSPEVFMEVNLSALSWK